MKKTITTILTAAAFFTACSDDSSSSAPSDSSVSSIYELGACNSSNRGETKYVQDKDDNYVCIGGEWIAEKEASSPKSSNSSDYAEAITSSDSGENPKEEIKEPAKQEVSIYTNAQTTLTINLTKYEQLKAMDEMDKNDGEPRISFTIKSSRDGVDEMDPVKTKKINLGNDVGYWFGSKEVSVLLPKGINIVQVCPKFVDEDAFFDDEEYTSTKCYAINDVGQKIDKTIKQTDNGSAYYTMDWEVTISY